MTNVTNYWRSASHALYQLLPTTCFLLILLAGVTTNVYVYGFTGANISDSTYRYAAIENEDLSWSIYQTLNGTTRQVAGFDNSTELLDVLNNQQTQEQLIRTLHNTNGLVHQLTLTIDKLIQTLQQFEISNWLVPSSVYGTTATMSGGSESDKVTVSNPATNPSTILGFYVNFTNNTQAAYNGNVTDGQANLIIALINGVISERLDDEALENIAPVAPEAEEGTSSEEETSSDGEDGGSDGGDGGGSQDNGNDPIQADPSQDEGIESEDGNGTEGGQDDGGSEQPTENSEEVQVINQSAGVCLIHPYCQGETEVPAVPFLQFVSATTETTTKE